MFSLVGSSSDAVPFETLIEKTPNATHFFMDCYNERFTLEIGNNGAELPEGFEDMQIELKKLGKYTDLNRIEYFKFIKNYGTHIITKATFGSKAEMRWSFPSSDSNLQNHQKEFSNLASVWENSKFQNEIAIPSSKLPKKCSMKAIRLGIFDDNFKSDTLSTEEPEGSTQIAFQVLEISNFFPEPIKSELAFAVLKYIEAMKPKKEEEILDGDSVSLYAIDQKKLFGSRQIWKVDNLFCFGQKLRL